MTVASSKAYTLIDVVGVVILVGFLLATGGSGAVLSPLRIPIRLLLVARAGHLAGAGFLVASQVISTVTVAPTFTSVGLLAIIVFIRTFLRLEMDIVDARRPANPPSAGRLSGSRSFPSKRSFREPVLRDGPR